MAVSAQFLIPPRSSGSSEVLLRALARAAHEHRDAAVIRERYRQDSTNLLALFGVGAPERSQARDQHVAAGRRAFLWDIGYFGPRKHDGYFRVSIDTDHPQAWLDSTRPDPSRWDAHGIDLREDADPAGPIVLVGLGRKSRAYLAEHLWERNTLRELRVRFPGKKILHRPKPRQDFERVDSDASDDKSPIESILRGASLVVARHSNVCVDAAIAGVPFECVDGAACWLQDREFTVANRLDFLRRLAWWQWMPTEASAAWRFLRSRV